MNDNNETKVQRNNISSKLVALDIYGQPVALTFRGHGKFKTPIGAILTITVGVILIMFGSFNLLKMNKLSAPT